MMIRLLAAILAIFMTVQPAAAAQPLAAPESFSHIDDTTKRSAAIFTEAAKVFRHARCQNCHPATNRPLQTDASTRHRPKVTRGEDGAGHAAMRCGNCHMKANREASRVPGASHWQMAPLSMSFVGKSAGEICLQIKDPTKNGDRPVGALVMHVAFDPLIAWAWTPGADRAPPPGTHQGFIALINEWLQTGSACPEAK